MSTNEPNDPVSFEEALVSLEGIVQRLERGEGSLDESLEGFEEGVRLLRHCRAALDSAEGRIRELVEIDENGTARLREFEHEATFDEPSPKARPKRVRKKKAAVEKPSEAEVLDDESEGLF